MEIKEKEKAVISWKDDDGSQKAIAFEQLYASLIKHQPVNASNIYRNAYPNISIRDEFSRTDYEYYRPGEMLPQSPKAKIQASMVAYKEHGIFRNIVDLMGDFACQGIDIAHPIKKVEIFYKEWFKLVRGKERSERIANLVCRTANVVVKRYTSKLSQREIIQLQQTTASPDTKGLIQQFPIEKREIPYKYIFLNPLSLDILNEDFVPFVDPTDINFAVIINPKLAARIQYPSNDAERRIVEKLPKDIVKAIKKGDKLIPLDSEKIATIFYKKDDWDTWAEPMVTPVLKDLNMLQKMKLADLSAIDGIVSQIRIWKLGDLEHKIIPNDAAVARLAEILTSGVGGGIVDLIWGPEIQLQETTTSLHQFLGDTKYAPILNAIFAGLGIPPLFSGSSNQGSFTNNFIAIKTLIERLEYIRDRIREFWNYEIKLVQKAMGFRRPASLVFDRMTLNDEASILQLLLHLVDRNYLSIESVQEMVGAVPEIEAFRIRREQKDISAGRLPPKAGPFHNGANYNSDAKKIFAQSGRYTPKELGIELEIDEDKPEDFGMPVVKENPLTNPKDEPNKGRPNNSKDKEKRKQKEVKPRRSVGSSDFINLTSWAMETQNFINDIVIPVYLQSLNKKNLRQLTSEEFSNFEKFKFYILMNLDHNKEITEISLFELIKSNLTIPEFVNKLFNRVLGKYTEKTGKEPTIDKVRFLQAATYALYHSKNTSKTDSIHNSI